MCRLLIKTGALTEVEVIDLLDETAANFRPTQRDGFGFAAFDKHGVLKARGRYYSTYPGWRNKGTHNSHALEWGKLRGRTQTLIIHGRTSTNVVGARYCHPFEQNDTVLAHNGVLDWIGPKKQKPKSKNDSESFLQWLVANDHPSPTVWADYWAGYGAIAVARPGHGLVVAKCGRANLSFTPSIKSGYILTTNPFDVPEWLREKGSKTKMLRPGVLMFDLAGELHRVHKFKGFGARKWDRKSALSYGQRYLGGQGTFWEE